MDGHGEPGHIALPTANHDFDRLRTGERTPEQLPPAFAFQLTFPTLPAIYYGDEIGLRYLPGLPDIEGSLFRSGYNRAGSRTPMQWDAGPNAGFSDAPAARLYLPIDPDPARPTVAGQQADQNSLLNTVRDLIALRRAHPELGSGGSLEILHDGYPLAYLRGGRFLVVINPSGRARVLPHDRPELADATAVRHTGVDVDRASITAGPFSFGIFRLLGGGQDRKRVQVGGDPVGPGLGAAEQLGRVEVAEQTGVQQLRVPVEELLEAGGGPALPVHCHALDP